MEITEIISKLIGNIECTGSHGEDMEVLKNLDKVEEIINFLSQKLIENSKQLHSNMASVNQVANKSWEILSELLQEINSFKEEEIN